MFFSNFQGTARGREPRPRALFGAERGNHGRRQNRAQKSGDASPDMRHRPIFFSSTTRRYGERWIRYVHNEGGHAVQNVHLQAQTLGLGSVPVGAFDDGRVSGVLSLPTNLEPIYMVSVGYVGEV